MAVHWALRGPSGKSEAGGWAAQEREAGRSGDWSIPGSLLEQGFQGALLSHRVTLNEGGT